MSQVENVISQSIDQGPTYANNAIDKIICGIVSEYALNVLKTKNSYLLEKIMDAFRGNYPFDELWSYVLYKDKKLTQITAKIECDNNGQIQYDKIINHIKMKTEDGYNYYEVYGLSFASASTFLKIELIDGRPYALYLLVAEQQSYFKSVNPSRTYKIEKQIVKTPVFFDNVENKPVHTVKSDDFFKIPSFNRLDSSQRSAVQSDPRRNSLILAGPGSGKTHSLSCRFCYLYVVHNIPIEKMKLLCFNVSASLNMRNITAGHLQEICLNYEFDTSDQEVPAETFDAFTKKIIENNYQTIGFREEPTFILDKNIKTEEFRYRFVKQVAEETGLINSFKKIGKELYDDLCKNANGYPSKLNIYSKLLNEVIRKQIETNTVIDFPFITRIVEESLKKDSEIIDELSTRYSNIFIDELQDLNNSQNNIIRELINGGVCLTMAGDDNQSIYGFRGANTDLIKEIRTNPEQINAQIYNLDVNYRCNPHIIAAGNDILRNTEHEIQIRSAKTDGHKIRRCDYHENYDDLAYQIKLNYITKKPEERICILCTTNDTIKKITAALQSYDVPNYHFEDDELFLSVPYLVFKALYIISNGGNVGYQSAYLKRLSDYDGTEDELIQYLIANTPEESFDFNTYSLKSLKYLMGAIDSTKNSSLLNDSISKYTSALDEIFNYDKNTIPDNTLTQFHSYALEHEWPPIIEDSESRCFKPFESNNSNGQDYRRMPRIRDDRVLVTTIFRAKGLEFNTVYITEMDANHFPYQYSIKKEQDRLSDENRELDSYPEITNRIRSLMCSDTLDDCLEELNSKEITDSLSKLLPAIVKYDLKDVYDCLYDSAEGLEDLSISEVKTYIKTYENVIQGIIKECDNEIYRCNRVIADCEAKKQQLLTKKYAHEINDDYYDNKTKELAETIIKEKRQSNSVNNLKMDFTNAVTKSTELFYRCKKLEHAINGGLSDVAADSNYDKNRIKYVENEQKRIFYVAITRASDYLYLCTPMLRGEQQKHSKFIDLIEKDHIEEWPIDGVFSDYIELKKNKLNEQASEEDADLDSINEITDDYLEKTKFLQNKYDDDWNLFVINHSSLKKLSKRSTELMKTAVNLMTFEKELKIPVHQAIIFYIQMAIETYIKPDSKYQHKLTGKKAESIYFNIKKSLNIIDLRIPGKDYITEMFDENSKKDQFNNLRTTSLAYYAAYSKIDYHVPQEKLEQWPVTIINGKTISFIENCQLLSMLRNVAIHDHPERTKEMVNHALEYALNIVEVTEPHHADNRVNQCTTSVQ